MQGKRQSPTHKADTPVGLVSHSFQLYYRVLDVAIEEKYPKIMIVIYFFFFLLNQIPFKDHFSSQPYALYGRYI